MEFTNDISFNDKLTEDKIAKINYNGKLVRNGANSVSIIYGFGANWDNTDAKEMKKADNGFEAEIKMLSSDTFNFCFRDENYNWDNNNYCNYISPIEKNTDVILEENAEEKINSTQAEVRDIEKEISILFDTLFNETKETNSNVQTATNNKEQNIITPSFIPYAETETTKSQEFNLDDLIEEILNPVISDSASLIENLAPAAEENNIEIAKDELTELPTHTEETATLVNDILVPFYAKQEDIITDSDVANINNIDNLIENLVSTDVNTTKNVVTPAFKDPLQELEEIEKIIDFDKLLEPDSFEGIQEDTQNVQKIEEPVEEIVSNKKSSDFTVIDDEEIENETKSEESSLLDEVINENENTKVEENVSLSVVEETSGLIVSPRKLGKLYFAKKKIKLALYKALVAIPRFLSKQFDSSANNN